MIPILFESGTTDFNSNGLGRLRDCISCTVTEERNGIYECEFEYPITGVYFESIEIGRIITCTHDDRGDYQPFIIYRREVPDLRGIVKFYAHHISYMLADIVVMPFTASSCSQALERIKTYSANTNSFTFWTDKTTTVNYKTEVPRLARNMLGGEENSILDVFGGGEYEFDKFQVKLYAARGVDSGVEIRYAKNLVDLDHDVDNSGTYNAAVPYWTDSEGQVVTLPEKYITYTGIGDERIDAAPMDLSSDFENKPTVAQLRSRAQSKLDSGKYWLADENIKVDFVALWQTEEYKEFAGLQRVSLCDTVSVYYPPAGVNAVKQKVVKTIYNVLLDRYDELELGTLSTSLGQSIKENILEIVPTTSIMEEAIKYASDLIRGGMGGYVVMTPGENGYPQEILIMDTPDVNTAVNVWRFNQGGLGHSHNGYNGPFNDIALTSDGRINANLITVGTLNADIIKAGTLSDRAGNTTFNLVTGVFTMKKGSINLGAGKFIATDAGKLTAIGGGVIRDPNSNTVFNLDTGSLAITKGSINLGSGNFSVTDGGVMTIKKGSINLGSGNFTVNDSGVVAIKSGSINIADNFIVTSAGLVTLKRGSINLGSGNFVVNDSGVVTIKSGSITLGENFSVTSAGLVTIKKGSINLGSGNFVVNDSGNVTIKSGSININDGAFKVTSEGAVTATSGKIGPFTIGSTALTYSSDSAQASVGQSNITYKSNSGSSERTGILLSGENIIFQKSNSQTSWSLPEKVKLKAAYSGLSTGQPELAFYFNGSSSQAIRMGEYGIAANGLTSYSNTTLGTYGGNYTTSIYGSATITKNLTVSGTKSRSVKTDNYSDRLHYCYETPTPLFGDIGEAVLDEEGICYVEIDDIFSETVAENCEYQVFLQAEGEGTCYIADKTPRYFVIKGTPKLRVAWELKSKQRDYENLRLEQADLILDEYENVSDPNTSLESYISEQEALLYG